MKIIYKISILLIVGLCFSLNNVVAQSNGKNWTKMSKEKETYFVNKALELIKEFGPGYYRPNERYDIEEFEYKLDGKYDSVSQNNGRKYYTIGFFYDIQKEIFKNVFIASVRFWKDTEEPWNITFGNNQEVLFLTHPYKPTRSKQEIVPFELDTLKMNEIKKIREEMKNQNK